MINVAKIKVNCGNWKVCKYKNLLKIFLFLHTLLNRKFHISFFSCHCEEGGRVKFVFTFHIFTILTCEDLVRFRHTCKELVPIFERIGTKSSHMKDQTENIEMYAYIC